MSRLDEPEDLLRDLVVSWLMTDGLAAGLSKDDLRARVQRVHGAPTSSDRDLVLDDEKFGAGRRLTIEHVSARVASDETTTVAVVHGPDVREVAVVLAP